VLGMYVWFGREHFERLYYGWSNLIIANVVYKRVEEFHSILFVVRSKNCVNFFKRKIVELMN